MAKEHKAIVPPVGTSRTSAASRARASAASVPPGPGGQGHPLHDRPIVIRGVLAAHHAGGHGRRAAMIIAVRRAVFLALALGATTAVGGCSGFSDASSCRRGQDAPTERGAVDAYYRGCRSVPTVVNGPYDGDKASTRYAAYADVVGFQVRYSAQRTRFLLVGRETQESAWRVLDGEGTGP